MMTTATERNPYYTVNIWRKTDRAFMAPAGWYNNGKRYASWGEAAHVADTYQAHGARVMVSAFHWEQDAQRSNSWVSVRDWDREL